MPSQPSVIPLATLETKPLSTSVAPFDRQSFLRSVGSGMPIAELFNDLHDVVFFAKDAAGCFVLCNGAFAEMAGVGATDDLYGKSDYDFFPKALAESYIEDDRRVLAGERISTRIELVLHGDRTIGWNLTSKLPLRDCDDVIIGTAGISRDFEKLHWENPTFQALAQVVDWRSYSRISGQTSDEREIARSGRALAMISATRCSWAGLA